MKPAPPSDPRPAELPDTVVEVCPETSPAPHRNRLIISNEGGLRKKGPTWRLVETVVSEIDPGRGNSFCVLEDIDGDYVQALRGFNGYHLEWHEAALGVTGSFQQYRAGYLGGSEKSFELKKHDHLSQGEFRDLLPVEEVVDAFRAFYNGAGRPGWLDWRLIDV